ncbi:LysR family transcriptional regulator [Gulosibacter sp. ACHW.36C]|uniref:LysR family transcriptional regulator n=1 Tax=Gulosibacter sediminis TaxID=1729695 RepID=A0ABY4MXK4_9MICO|nr:LysR family transcriptional regulator [Gulosibacter sediminis]UQN14802.1 LysR family transcriptional regulator [Gulosibacter sediminis]
MPLPAIDDWTFFDRVAHATSLTQVARDWGVSLTAVSKRLTSLETRLGTKLVHRSTRAMTLTEAGALVAEGAARIVHDIRETEERLASVTGLRGTLAVHSTIGLGRAHIAPLLRELAGEHPHLAVELELSSLPLTMSDAAFDLGIRVGSRTPANLASRLLHRQRRVLCASPDYRARRGAPETLEELAEHDCIVLRQDEGDYALWRFGDDGERVVRATGRLTTSDGDVATDWCRAGGGIMLRSQWQVRPLISRGELVPVLPSIPTPEANITAVFHPNTGHARRIGVALDHLEAGLAERLGD